MYPARIALLAAVCATGCGLTPLTVVRLAPAEINLPTGKVVAVATILGPEGDQLSAALTRALVETQRFQVVERRKLDAVMGELRFSAEGHVSDDSAMSFGEMTGAAVLVVGDVHEANYRETLTDASQTCTRDGVAYDCVLRTRTAEGSLRVTLELVETETGKVLAAKTLSAARTQSTQATDAEPPPIDAATTFGRECREEVVAGFVRVVAPHEIQVTVYLRSDDDLPELEAGNNYAQLGRWDDAIAQYRAAVARSGSPPFSPAQRAMALYDLGVGLGYSGAFDDGIEALEQAFVTDPETLYRDQVQRVKQFREDAARLAEQQK